MSSSPSSQTPSSPVSPLTSLRIHQLIPAPSSTTDQGPFVFGYAFSFGLMGVLSAQCFCYFRKFPDDRVETKILVALVLFLESLITIFALHGFWVSVIVRGSDLSAIVGTGIGGQYLSSAPIWSFVAIAILTGLVSSITHGFFCWRIWIVGQSLIVPVFVMMVSLLQCAMVSYGAVKYGLVPDLNAKHPMPFYVPLWLSGSLVCDLTITTSMTCILLRGRSECQNFRPILSKLIKLILETGLVITTAAVVELVLAVTFRVTMWHLAVFYILSKLYANCLMATLNARLILRDMLDDSKTVTLTVWDRLEFRSQSLRTTAVQINAETELGHDTCPVDEERPACQSLPPATK